MLDKEVYREVLMGIKKAVNVLKINAKLNMVNDIRGDEGFYYIIGYKTVYKNAERIEKMNLDRDISDTIYGMYHKEIWKAIDFKK